MTVPAFSPASEAGIRKTSVPMSCGRISPSRTGRPAYQKRCGLGFGHVAHDQPIELGQPRCTSVGIMAADRRVLAEHEHAADDAVAHRQVIGNCE